MFRERYLSSSLLKQSRYFKGGKNENKNKQFKIPDQEK